MDRRPRRSPNRMTTRSGRSIKVNRSLGERVTSMREAKSLRKVQRMRGMPKNPWKRAAWRSDPKRIAEYWFSRDGAIMGLKIAGIAILVMFVLTLGVFAYFRKDLPNVKDISGGNLGGSISYYDRTGQTLLWQDYNAVKRVPVPSNEISPYLKQATVAVEDRDFYKHRGFDVKGIGRAAVNDFIKHGSTQGGSTITQQLVKLNQDWTQKRSVTRKVKELILAVELERTYTKDEILTGYLNSAPYGGVDHGAQAAASDYFHKDAKELTLAQAAMLASIPKAPAVYSPYSGEFFNKPAFLSRQHYVLDVMAQTHQITKQQADQAKKEDVLAEVQPKQDDKYAGIKAPYFVLAAKHEIEKKFTCNTGAGCNKIGGWKVITTMDSKMQAKAEQLVKSNSRNALAGGADEQALVAEDVPTGQMVALVGGTDFNNTDHGQINYAQTPIPPGSSFKPYDYVSLIDNTTNAGAGAVLYDVQQPIPGYSCTNKNNPKTDKKANCLWDYDFKYPGALTLRYALGGSRNVPAVKAMLTVGTDKTIKTANALMAAPDAYNCFGDAALTKKAPCYGASAIGDGAFLHLDQHVNGLASLGRLGQAIPNTYIMEIYKSGSKKPFYKWQQPKPKQAVRAEAAYIVDDMASDGNASYLPTGFYKFHNYKGWRIAVKTGTTNDNYDGLMTAWTTKYAVASWVGYHTRQKPLHAAGMEYLTTPLTRGLITSALDGAGTPQNWTAPPGIKKMPAYVVRSHVGVGSIEPSPSTDIFPSWYQSKNVTTTSQTIDKVSGKNATSCTPALAKQFLGSTAAANSLSADIFYGPNANSNNSNNSSSPATGSDDVHSCSDSPPSVASVFINGQDVTAGGSATCSGTCNITTTVNQGTHQLSDSQHPQYPGTVRLMVSGQEVQSKTVSDSPSSVTFNYSGSGTVSVSIQVIDSVLYEATSAAASVTFTSGNQNGNGGGQGGGGGEICFPPNSRHCRELDGQQGMAPLVTYISSLFLSRYLRLF